MVAHPQEPKAQLQQRQHCRERTFLRGCDLALLQRKQNTKFSHLLHLEYNAPLWKNKIYKQNARSFSYSLNRALNYVLPSADAIFSGGTLNKKIMFATTECAPSVSTAHIRTLGHSIELQNKTQPSDRDTLTLKPIGARSIIWRVSCSCALPTLQRRL